MAMKARGGGGAGKKKKGKSPPAAAAAAAAAAASSSSSPSFPSSPSSSESAGAPGGDMVATAADASAVAVAADAEADTPVVIEQATVDRIAQLVKQAAKRAAEAAAVEAAAATTEAEAQDFAANPASSLDEDIPDTPPPPPLPELAPADGRALRWALDSTVDERLAALEGVEGVGAPLERLVMANRNLLGQRFFIALTSRVLAAEVGGDAAAATRLRALRNAVLAITWRVDQPFHAAVLAAEGRLMAVVSAPNPDRAANGRSIGESAGEVSGFWTVLYSSVTAWEERGRVAPELVNVDVQAALRAVVDRFRSRPAAMEVVRPEMKWLGDFFVADPADQQAMVGALGDSDEGEEVLVGLGTLINQLHLFPVNAYGGLLERLITVYDFALQEVYEGDTREGATRFTPESLNFESKLVAFVDASR